jgi:hypothetical protein
MTNAAIQDRTALPYGGVICLSCGTCVMRHYAVTQGRCWNCRAALNEDAQACTAGGGI